ncbi:MAG: Ferritin and Dps [Thermoleophilia bacterium]|jgi:ferritin|nr:Ferritin and Dps [Thermoleophilia bacterium]
MHADVRAAIEQQVGNEFHAAHTYLSMSGYFEAENLPGFASWMRAQSEEEIGHAMKLFDFLVDRGIAPELPSIAKPHHGFDGAVSAFSAAFEHEKAVTQQIHRLYELSLEHRDYTAQVLLQWFISEQLEEEKTTGGILERLKMVEGSKSALLILDAELGSRQGDQHAH